MNKIGRRLFCGSALMAFPLVALRTQDLEISPPQTDFLIDTLADEITRITADGAQKGFHGEHFRRYAAVIRAFGAHMEGKGVNRELNRRLEEDDFSRLDPAAAARITSNYWNRKGLSFNPDDLARQIASMPRQAYLEIKSAVKRRGGARWLFKAAAEAFERRAEDYEAVVYRGGLELRNGKILLPALSSLGNPGFMAAQYDFSIFYGTMMLDCLCRALIIMGSAATILCFTVPGAQELCAVGAFLLALANLMQSLGMCDADRC